MVPEDGWVCTQGLNPRPKLELVPGFGTQCRSLAQKIARVEEKSKFLKLNNMNKSHIYRGHW